MTGVLEEGTSPEMNEGNQNRQAQECCGGQKVTEPCLTGVLVDRPRLPAAFSLSCPSQSCMFVFVLSNFFFEELLGASRLR